MEPSGVKMAAVIGAVVFAAGCVFAVILPIETASRIVFATISTFGLIVSMLVLLQSSLRGSSAARQTAFSTTEQMAREERFIRDAMRLTEERRAERRGSDAL